MTERKRFTDNSIKAMKPKSERYEEWEGHGFGVRVAPTGAKAFVLLYKFQGRPRRMTIGTYGAVSLADARIKLAEARKLLLEGKDPGAELVEKRKAEREADTVAELIADFLAKHSDQNKREASAAEDRRQLMKDVEPAWGTRKAKEITRRDVRKLLDGILARGAPSSANHALAVIRKMFAWALEHDIVEINPCAGITAPAKNNQRDRVLTVDEIATLWSGMNHHKVVPTTRSILRLMLLTAQRLGEVRQSRWGWFDLNHRVMTIPQEIAKNNLAHRVPLSAQAMALLEQIKADLEASSRKTDASSLLFPSTKKRDAPYSGTMVEATMRDYSGVKDATPHDLRRTAASHMTSLGISRLVVSKVLNHAETGITAVYDRHSYDAEKRHALDAWGRRLDEIVSGKSEPTNVTELRRA
jgi:integrase